MSDLETTTPVSKARKAAAPKAAQRKPQRPKQWKPIRFLFRVTDELGNPIDGAAISLLLATRDLEVLHEKSREYRNDRSVVEVEYVIQNNGGGEA